MENALLQLIPQYGGLAVVAGFAWLLLKSVLKQQERLAKLLDNHLTSLLEHQKATNELLTELVKELKGHSAYAQQVGAVLLERTKGGRMG